MKLYRTAIGAVVENDNRFYVREAADWNALLRRPDLPPFLSAEIQAGKLQEADASAIRSPLPPADRQEVWAAGVTYLRSRVARMEESKSAGGGDFYDRVYAAERPEIFFKSSGWRVVGPGADVRIRRDAQWSVPEPELTLLVSSAATITGYTIGNDVSSRDIEGENPLYLPQAKSYDGSCALGPCILLASEPLPQNTSIRIQIQRKGLDLFVGQTEISQLKRPLNQLVHYLCRETSFPDGCFLMTGTGIVPPDSFKLQRADIIHINIPPIGTLTNRVAQ